jgi:tetratricopeptide (TPR) repeat protein
MSEIKDPLEIRISRLGDYLIRAHKFNKASILFAMYLSEFARVDVENSLKRKLKEAGLETMDVNAGEYKNLPGFFVSNEKKEMVFLVKGMEKGFPDVLNYLNFKREDLVENKIKVVFWVTENELTRISLEAPDFFAFRNRVVEFMETPLPEEKRASVVDFVRQTEYKSLDEIKKSIELKEKLLSELSGIDEISGYLLSSLGTLYEQISSYQKAIEYHEKALAISLEIGDKQNEGNSFKNLGLAFSALGQVEKAIEYYEKALVIAIEIGDRRDEGNAMRNLGDAYIDLGQVEKAIEYYEKALAIDLEIRNRRGEGKDLGNLGNAYIDLGQVEKAIEYYEKALAIDLEIRNRRGEGKDLGNLGNAYIDLGKVEKAIEYYEKALMIAIEIGDRRNEGAWLGNLGTAFRYLGEVEKAIKYFEKALVIAKEIGDKRGEGTHLNNIGATFQTQEKYTEALVYHLLAREIRIQIKDPNLKTTESNLNNLKEELGEKEFEKLMAKTAPGAQEIVRKMLEGAAD